MSDPADVFPSPRRKPWLRWLMALLALVSLAVGIVVIPSVLLVTVMSFDAPDASWQLLHVPLLGVPVLLVLLTLSAAWAAWRGSFLPIKIVSGLALVELLLIAWLWFAG